MEADRPSCSCPNSVHLTIWTRKQAQGSLHVSAGQKQERPRPGAAPTGTPPHPRRCATAPLMSMPS